jgi:NAD-dependent deacetylase
MEDLTRESKIAACLARSRGRVVWLTGAGISAESGIPTFRGPQGYWQIGSRNYYPEELATHDAFCRMPDEVWLWYLYRRSVCRAAKPNAAHRALVSCEHGLGERFTLITQNVDGLHLRAGNTAPRTYQIHGNIDFMRCAEACCDDLFAIPEAIAPKNKGDSLTTAESALLVCPKCGSRARPHVLWFDESYNEVHFRFHSSLKAAETCDLLIVVGTAGATNLPNQVLRHAINAGAKVIDVNPDENPFSAAALASGGAWLQGPAAEYVPDLVQAMLALRA